jgi:hypothetical protein
MKKLLILLLFGFSICFSQAPGFLGRKLCISAFGSFDIAFSNPVSHNQNLHTVRPYGINTRWAGNINYVITPRSSIGIDFHYLNTGFKIPSNYADYGGDPIYSDYGDLEACYFGLSFQTYFGNNLSPVGPYIKLEAGGVYYSALLFNLANTAAVKQIESGTIYAMGSVGRKHILFRRLTIDYGLQIGVTAPESITGYLSGNHGTDHQQYDDIETTYAIRQRLFVHTLFNFYAGIGIVL